jgi:hypothetical protein
MERNRKTVRTHLALPTVGIDVDGEATANSCKTRQDSPCMSEFIIIISSATSGSICCWHEPNGLSVLIFLPVPQTTAKEEPARPRDGRPWALVGGAARTEEEIMEVAIASACSPLRACLTLGNQLLGTGSHYT